MGQWTLVPLEVKKEALSALYFTAAVTIVSVTYFFIAQPELPIFYTLPLPNQALVSKSWIFLFPAISFLITLIQLIMIGVFKDLAPLILKLFAWMTSFMQVLLLMVIIRIILITF